MATGFWQPREGWRAFAGEVGTIVLGVLLALGAQELVQGLHWRNEVRETRKALDAELARDLAAFDYRYNNRRCIADRLAELSRWSASLAAGRPLPLKAEIDEPPFFSIRTAAWEVTDGEIASRVPLQAKLNYAALYDGLRMYYEMKRGESDAWALLNQYGAATTADAADLRAIKGALKDIADTNEALEAFRTPFHRFARELRIEPERNLDGTANPLVMQWQKEACRPLL